MSNDQQSGEKRSLYIPALLAMGGLGGVLPSLSGKAIYYSQFPGAELPELGFYFALVLFFFVGAIVGFVVGGNDLRQTVFAGIAAPAIITGAFNGYEEGKAAKSQYSQLRPNITSQENDLSLHPSITWPQDVSNGLALIIKTSSKQKTDRELLSQSTKAQLTVEAKIPKNLGGPLSKEVIYIYQSLNEAEWIPNPVAEVTVGNTIQYRSSSDPRTLGFVAGDATATIQIKGEFAGKISLEFGTASRSDFLWALGFRRSTKITAIHPKITKEDSSSQCPRISNSTI